MALALPIVGTKGPVPHGAGSAGSRTWDNLAPRGAKRSAPLVALALAIAACAPDAEMHPQNPVNVALATSEPPPSPSPVGDPLDGSNAGRPGVLVTDSQLAAVIEAAGGAEAREAVELLVDQPWLTEKHPSVTALAHRIESDQEASSRELKEIETKASLVPLQNPTSRQLRARSRQTIASLRSASPADLDRTFVELQVREDRDLLQLLDGTLLPRVANAELTTHLKNFRGIVARELQAAEDVAASLR